MRSHRGSTLFLLGIGVMSLSCAPGVFQPQPAPVPTRVLAPANAPALAEPGVRSEEAAVVAFFESRFSGLLPGEVRQVARAVCDEAHRVGLSPTLVTAVIDVESSGYSFALSPVGAVGLMQLLPTTGAAVARELGVPWRGPASLADPVINVRLGVHYLASLIGRFGSVEEALAAYNWGPTRIAVRIQRGQGVPAVYARRVLDVFNDSDREPGALPPG